MKRNLTLFIRKASRSRLRRVSIFLATLLAGFAAVLTPGRAGEAAPIVSEQGQPRIAIATDSAVATDLANLVFNYKPGATHLKNKGDTVEATIDPGSTLEALGKTYKLERFHLHAPSLHILDGTSFPLEMHLSHRDAQGKLAIVGVFFKEGAANPGLDVYFKNLPENEGETHEAAETAPMDVLKALPLDRLYFTYNGLLTTPSYTEGVTWFVMKAPMTASKEQIEKYSRMPHRKPSNREIQDPKNRTVRLDSTP